MSVSKAGETAAAASFGTRGERTTFHPEVVVLVSVYFVLVPLTRLIH